jgi:chloramphenicol 3-O phosphotransferase
VVLNGTSSAGKSSIADGFRELRAGRGECWLVIGIDDFFTKLHPAWMRMPGFEGAFAEQGVQFDQAGDAVVMSVGPLGLKVWEAFRRSVRAVALVGFNVVVDEVMLDRESWDRWRAALDDLPVAWVGVRCDVDIAHAREAARGDRIVGTARGQADLVHAHATYDIELDTTNSAVADLVRELDEALGAPSNRQG